MKTVIAIVLAGLVSTSAIANETQSMVQANETATTKTETIYSSESLRKSIRQSAVNQLRIGKQQLAMHPTVAEENETELAYREIKSRTEKRVEFAL